MATEVSEALKAVRFVKPGGDFVLFAAVWQPTAVMLGKAPYPELEAVVKQVEAAGARPVVIDPEVLPLFEGQPVPDNVYTLGVAAAETGLGRVIAPAAVAEVIGGRWKRGVAAQPVCVQLSRGHGSAMSASPRQPFGPDERPEVSSLEPFFTPRAVALVGSVAEGKLGYELLRQMLAGGYRDVVAINPKGQGALGVPGCSSLTAAGLPVDLAVIASPAGTVAAVLEECGQAGVSAAVIISSGFGEMGNQAGEAEIKAVAAANGLRIVGPNCAGIINTAHRLCPTLETLPPPGHVAIISQSGALAGVLLGWAKRDGLGISKFVSYGNRRRRQRSRPAELPGGRSRNARGVRLHRDRERWAGIHARGRTMPGAKAGHRDQGGPRGVGATRDALPHGLSGGQRRGLRRGFPPVRSAAGVVSRGDVRPVPR